MCPTPASCTTRSSSASSCSDDLVNYLLQAAKLLERNPGCIHYIIAFQLAPGHRAPTWPDFAVQQQMHLDIMVESVADATPSSLVSA